MFSLLPPTLLSLVFALPALSYASPQPALVGTDWEISLIPRHTLFLRQVGNLQTFEQALGGTRASSITNSGDPQRPFTVDGDTFDTFESAAQRSCDNQFQACQNVANGNGNGNNNNNNNSNNANRNGGGNGNNGNGNRVNAQSNDNNGNNNRNNNNGNNNNGNNNNGQRNRSREKRQNGGLTVQQCDQQKSQCNNAQQNAQVKNFVTGIPSQNIGPDPQFPDFDLICDS